MIKRILTAIMTFFFLGEVSPASISLHPKFNLDFSERFRMVSWDNAISLADSAGEARTFTRHRTSLGGQWLPDKNLEFTLKLTNEFRYYFVPEGTAFNLNEIFIDQLYVKWRHQGTFSGTLTFGRQNIILGEGFMVIDGQALDGSRGIYFNAVRYDWDIKDKHRLTFFYTYMPEKDDWLPVIHDQKQQLVEQDEEGIGLYYSGDMKKYDLDVYFIRKNVKPTGHQIPESSINNLGSRFSLPLSDRFSYTIEGGFQFGKRGLSDRAAIGGYMYFDYKTRFKRLKNYLPQVITAGAIYLSGDNPDDDKWGAWDPIFGRFPKWSESFIYTQIQEDGVAFWSNLISLHGRFLFKFAENISFTFDYHHLRATEKPRPGSFPGGDGKTRGNLVINRLSYKFNKYWSGHIVWEMFTPGNYYFNDADGFGWLRSELMFTL
ncbi:MAG: alginate export family protein [candidate division Zixibacteria bacterium]|nr:alginate export family protein [candidate division Zixibacteria bacterium]